MRLLLTQKQTRESLNTTIFVYERQYTANPGLFDWDGFYESIQSLYSNQGEMCWNYGILDGISVGDGGEEFDVVDTVCSEIHRLCDTDTKLDNGDGLVR